MTTAQSILNAAAGHMQARAATYDKPEGERSMGKAVQAFNAIAGRDLSEAEGWLLLAVLKNVRLFQRPGYHADSAEDAVAYGALLAEAKAREVVQPAAVPYIGPDRRARGNDLDDMVRAGLGGTEQQRPASFWMAGRASTLGIPS